MNMNHSFYAEIGSTFVIDKQIAQRTAQLFRMTALLLFRLTLYGLNKHLISLCQNQETIKKQMIIIHYFS